MKKEFNIIILTITILLSLSIGLGNFNRYPKNNSVSDSILSSDFVESPFTYGVKYLPFTIDPQDCKDCASQEVLIQVMETLFTYNYSDPTLPVIPLLAADFGTWDTSKINYTIDLKTGVTFHDGSIFDADDVIFTFERQAWLYNFTGLNTGYVPNVYEQYIFPNGTPIIKNIVKIGANTITFVLNGIYGPFVDLLCYIASSILTDTYYDITGGIVELNEDVVGTGPFIFESYEEDVEVVFSAYSNYWQGKTQIDEMVFVRIKDFNYRNLALFVGDIHFIKDPLPEMVDVFKAYPDINVVDTGDNSGGIQFLLMNNVLINRTWREAISYAFDYNYLINEIRYGHADRLKSPVGYGIKYSNWTFPVPTYNVTKARQVMQSMGFGVGWNATYNSDHPSLDESKWTSTTFKSLNYSYDINNNVQKDVFIMLIRDLKKIGIQVTDAGSNWDVMLYKVYELHGYPWNDIELLFLNWCPDVNDPSNFINLLFTNRSVAFNAAQYNGYTEAIKAGRNANYINDNVQLLMEAALVMEDGPAREALYDRMQELLIEDFVCVWGYCSRLTYAHHIKLTGFQQNLLNLVYFYSCQWNPGSHVGVFQLDYTLIVMIIMSISLIANAIFIIYIWRNRRIK